MQKNQRNKLLAGILAGVLAISALAIGLTGTFAARADIPVTLERQNNYPTLAVGATLSTTPTGARRVDTSDAAILTASLNLSNGEVATTGVKAGIAVRVTGSNTGNIARVPYQVFDDALIGSYVLKKGGQVDLDLKAGKDTAARAGYLTTTPAGAAITWSAVQSGVVTVDANTGLITAIGKGAAIVLGKFTDKWGIPREVSVLVMVGIKSGSLADLLEQIAKGEGILELDPNPYDTGSLEDLLDAVNGGKDIVNDPDPSEQDIQNAIDEIKEAINNLKQKPQRPGGIIGPDDNGDYYTPVGDPPNVYEVVDKDGNSKEPPEYVYNPGDPTDGNNRDAEKDGGFYYVEDPEGSNIWKPVDKDGNLDEDRAIWGGPDGKPGGGDDKPVNKFDNEYWINRGQNIWQKVNPNGNNRELGELTGGGFDEDPTTNPATPIEEYNGKFYYGPLSSDEDDKMFYYGDHWDPAIGNGKVMSDPLCGQHPTDDKFYLVDGKMVPAGNGDDGDDELPEVGTGNPGVADPGRVLTPDKTGDSSDWIEIATSGGYSLIIRKNYINTYSSGHYGDPSWQYTSFGSNTKYGDSQVRTKINLWFNGTAGGTADKLSAEARLRNYTMHNDAYTVLGSGTTTNGYTNGFSKPNKYQIGLGNEVAFALSYGEAAIYCSKRYEWGGGTGTASSQAAQNNFAKLVIPSGGKAYDSLWLRSPGNSTGAHLTACEVDSTGRLFQKYIDGFNGEYGLCYPALWVNSAIFN